MKGKERLARLLLAAIMMVTIVSGLMDGKTVEAADVSVTMGSTVLANGYYYFDSSGNLVPCSDVSSISDYMQYQDGVLTIYGSVSGTLRGGMQVSAGTLTIKGDGNLNLAFYGNLSGLGSVITDDYTGNITLSSPVTTPVNGLSSLQLRTTGTIVIESSASSLNSNSYAISTGSLVLEGASVILNNNPTITTTGNAEITATGGNLEFQAAFNQPLFLTNTPTAVFALKAPNGSVKIVNFGTGSSLGVNGNLNVTAKNDVTIMASLQAVNGTANIESTEGDVSLSTSGNTSAVSGDLTVRALNGNVSVSGSAINGGSLIGNTDIQAKSKINIQNGGNGITISGDAVLKSAEDEIKLEQVGAVPIVTGNLTISTPLVARIATQTSSSAGLIMGTLTSDDVVVLGNGSDVKYFSGGNTTPSATCPHTRRNTTGKCLACGNQLPVASVNGVNYNTLNDAIANANNNDTVTLLMDITDDTLMVSIGNKDITLDLADKTLQLSEINADNSLIIKNGNVNLGGSLKTTSVTHTGVNLKLDNAKVTTEWFQWMSLGTVELCNSTLVVDGTNISFPTTAFAHKIEMDKASRIEIKNVSGGLSTYSNFTIDAGKSVEEYGLYSIKKLLPKNAKLLATVNSYNVCESIKVVDKTTNQPLRDLVLCYKNIADADVTLSETSFTYSGEQRMPSFIVKYGADELEENIDYTFLYSDNIDAGATAKIILNGNENESAYYGTKTIFFTIQKAPQAAPTGLVPTAETIDGKNDGKIANLSSKMEYSVDNRTWIDANAEVLTNLPDGDYYVRFKETANYYASPSTKVTVAKGTIPTQQDTTGSTTTQTATTQQTKVDTPKDATTQEPTGVTDKTVSTGDAYPLAIMLTLMIGTGVWIVGMIRRRKEER